MRRRCWSLCWPPISKPTGQPSGKLKPRGRRRRRGVKVFRGVSRCWCYFDGGGRLSESLVVELILARQGCEVACRLLVCVGPGVVQPFLSLHGGRATAMTKGKVGCLAWQRERCVQARRGGLLGLATKLDAAARHVSQDTLAATRKKKLRCSESQRRRGVGSRGRSRALPGLFRPPKTSRAKSLQ